LWHRVGSARFGTPLPQLKLWRAEGFVCCPVRTVIPSPTFLSRSSSKAAMAGAFRSGCLPIERVILVACVRKDRPNNPSEILDPALETRERGGERGMTEISGYGPTNLDAKVEVNRRRTPRLYRPPSRVDSFPWPSWVLTYCMYL
jgi:hypothetical protein